MDQMNDRARETQTGDDFLITRREKQKKILIFSVTITRQMKEKTTKRGQEWKIKKLNV